MGGNTIDILLSLSPFLFVIMSAYILFELIRIHKYFNIWEVESLCIVPISIALLYSWVAIFNPEIEVVRIFVRLTWGITLGVTSTVIYSISYRFRKGG